VAPTVLPASFVEEVVFSSMHVLGSFVKNQVAIYTWVYIWIFHSVPLIFMSVFVPVSCCFHYYDSVV
jgi:hypothetical protein